jgi:hypothetical protein
MVAALLKKASTMPWSIALAVFTSGFMGRKQPENWLFAS